MKYDPETATFDEEPEATVETPIHEAPTLELHDRFEQVLGD